MAEELEEPAASISRKILHDAPVESDKFSGGGHQRTAAAVARAIRQFANGDRAIGLEGAWGSGKSSIVRMASRELQSTTQKPAYRVFTYDLWANQTGHFRRSFLESLLSWAADEFPHKLKNITDWRDRISSKRQRITTNNYRSFSWFGIATVAFLYASPIIYTWMAPPAFRDSAGHGTITVGAIIAWLALGFYIGILIFTVLLSFPKQGTLSARWQEALSRTLSIFSKDSEERNIDQSIRDEDPTQYEFRSIFRDILKNLQSDKIRIIAVFDNIDRLPSDKIAETWSEVRAVFSSEGSTRSEGTSIIAIVPYAEPIAEKAMIGSGADLDGSEEGVFYLQSDVFRKSFDVIFNVAPPVVSDISAFFSDMLTEAVGTQVSSESKRRVYRIFDLHADESGIAVTPRQILSFINDLTSQWEQWQDQIAIETVAIFVCYKNILLANPGRLRKEGFIDKRLVQHAQQPEIYRDLAALSYNVQPELAFQVLSYDRIRRALVADEPAILKELAASAGQNGFIEILHKVVDASAQSWVDESLEEFSAAVNNIASLSLDSSDLVYSQRSLLDALVNTTTLDLKNVSDLPGLWAVFGFTNDAEVGSTVRKFVLALNRSLPEPAKQTLAHGRIWIKTIGAICNAVRDAKSPQALASALGAVTLPAGTQAVIGAAFDADTTDYHIRQFRGTVSSKPLTDALEAFAGGTETFVWAWPELSHLVTDDQKIQLLSITADSIKQQAAADSDEVRWRFQSLEMLWKSIPSDNTSAREIVEQLFHSGAPFVLAHQAADALGEQDNAITTIAIWISMRIYGWEVPSPPNIQQTPIFGNVTSHYNWFRDLTYGEEVTVSLMKGLAALAVEHAAVSDVVQKACEEPDDRNLFKYVAVRIFDDKSAPLPVASILTSKFLRLQQIFGNNFESFLELYGQRSDASTWSDLKIAAIPREMVNIVAGRTESGWVEFRHSLDEGLKAVDANGWQSEFDEKGVLLDVLETRNKLSPLHLPVPHFYEAFLRATLNILSGDDTGPNSHRNFDAMFESLPQNSQRRFRKDLYERHRTSTEGISASLVAMPRILGGLPFESDADRTIDRYLIPLLKAGTEQSIAFVEENGPVFKKALAEASEEQRGLVTEFLGDTSGENPNDDSSQSLRITLGLKPQQPSARD